jgi:hypothetical protein
MQLEVFMYSPPRSRSKEPPQNILLNHTFGHKPFGVQHAFIFNSHYLRTKAAHNLRTPPHYPLVRISTFSMRISSLVFVLSLFFVSIYGQGLIDVLNANGFTEFATDLQLHPELLAKLTGRNDLTVWAPINDAVNPVNSTLRRRQTAAEYSVHVSHTGQPPQTEPITRKRQGRIPNSNFLTLRTFLEDPEFVNLGNNQPVRVVQSYATPPPFSSLATLEIVSGTGDPVEQVSGPFKYNDGLIYGVNRFAPFLSPPACVGPNSSGSDSDPAVSSIFLGH